MMYDLGGIMDCKGVLKLAVVVLSTGNYYN